jgi:hypothetical protein
MEVLAPGIGEIIGGSQREERSKGLDRIITEAVVDWFWDAGMHSARRYSESAQLVPMITFQLSGIRWSVNLLTRGG